MLNQINSILIAIVIVLGMGLTSFSVGQSLGTTESLKESCFNPTNMTSNYRTMVCTHTFGVFNNSQFNDTIPEIDPSCVTSTGWYLTCGFLGPNGNSTLLDQVYSNYSQDGGQSFESIPGLAMAVNSSEPVKQNFQLGISQEHVYQKWEQTMAPNNKNDVFLRISDDGGETWGEPINISNSPGSDSIQSSLNVDSFSGKYTITWVEVYPSGWAVKFTCGMC